MTPTAPEQRPSTILIVDDEDWLRDFLAYLLEDHGHRVLQANNGRRALELVRAEHPDLVISDVMMPVMGGVELSRNLKSSGFAHAGRRTPVILMSSAGPRAAEGSAADAFLNKPFDLELLEQLVQKWLIVL